MKKRIEYTYDEEADVMYISFGTSKPGICHEVEEGMLLRKDSSTGKWCGLTVINFSKRCSMCPEMMEWHYDEKPADVMYISFGKSEEAISHQVEGGIYFEKSTDSKKWCGLTIVDFRKRCNSI